MFGSTQFSSVCSVCEGSDSEESVNSEKSANSEKFSKSSKPEKSSCSETLSVLTIFFSCGTCQT